MTDEDIVQEALLAVRRGAAVGGLALIGLGVARSPSPTWSATAAVRQLGGLLIALGHDRAGRRAAAPEAQRGTRQVKRFWTTVALVDAPTAAGRSRSTARPLKTPARDDAGRCDARAGRGDRRGMARVRRGDRPARDAADRARQCRDRPCRARPAALCRRPCAHMPRATLLCYRADHPPKLVAAQAEAWDPLLDWARRRFDVDFAVDDRDHPRRAAAGDGRAACAAARRARRRSSLRPCRRWSPSADRWSPRWRCSRARSTLDTAWDAVDASTSAGRSSNGARTTKRSPRWPIAAARLRSPRRASSTLA